MLRPERVGSRSPRRQDTGAGQLVSRLPFISDGDAIRRGRHVAESDEVVEHGEHLRLERGQERRVGIEVAVLLEVFGNLLQCAAIPIEQRPPTEVLKRLEDLVIPRRLRRAERKKRHQNSM